ncbi:MAG TPA: serine hydrolase domain-containing protein [Rhizomicrobium sp.]|nr:serine hydrolase domain-containing protein [Rhizomicrobium sp.]
MKRRDILKATGATMIASTLPAKVATPAGAGKWDKARLEQAAAVMADWIKDGRVQGASILVTQGSRQFARNFGTARGAEPVFLLASISKPMTAAAVMTLVDQGQLSLDDTVVKFFPTFTGEGRETITIRHLLTHTAGLPDMLPNDEMLRQNHAPLSDYREGALKAPLKFPPGTGYSYASMGILLSAEIAQKITGKPIADIAEERVFRPLGMGHTGLGLRGRDNATTVPSQAAPATTEEGKKSWADWNWNSLYWRNLGAPWGGALGSAADINRFYREFLDQRGTIMKPANELLMVTNQSPPGVKASGLGFDLPPSAGAPGCGPRTFGHNGSTGTYSWADPDTGTICVVLTSLYEAAVRPHPTHLVGDLVAQAVAGA